MIDLSKKPPAKPEDSTAYDQLNCIECRLEQGNSTFIPLSVDRPVIRQISTNPERILKKMSIKAETGFSMKDALFNPESVALLSSSVKRAYPKFKKAEFEGQVLARFPDLELKQRINWLVESLYDHLPGKFLQATAILDRALPKPLDPDLTDNDFGEYIWVVPGEFVAKYGCTRQHLAHSLEFLKQSTRRFTAEGAIRPFLSQFMAETMDFVTECAGDENYHVRRLASEGIRPFLPWAERVLVPHDKVTAVLDLLYADPTRYVTRSVANTVNDLSKVDSELAVKTLRRWRRDGLQARSELDWMTRHGLRTLLKTGNPGALALLGFTKTPHIKISNLQTSSSVRVGEQLSCSFSLESSAPQKLLLLLKVFYLKANGSFGPKLFHIKTLETKAIQRDEISKNIQFKPMTTRVMYPGKHQLQILVNGQVMAERDFVLQAD